MKVKYILLIIPLILSLIFISTGCSAFSANKKAEEVTVAFLTEFFSINKNDRYRSFSESTEDIEKSKEIYDDYYLPFNTLASQKCIETMKANRLPFKYDGLAFDNNLSASISNLKIELVRENVYSYEITFNSVEANELFKAPLKGKITLSTFENEVLVDSFTINK